MSLKTFPSATSLAFASAGITLTPEQEHVAAEAEAAGKIDWASVLQKLGQLAVQVIPLIIAIFGSEQAPPSPPQVKGAAHCCDHHHCCCESLKAAIHTVDVISKHMCQCCC
jgi:hypothetical protein